MQLVTSEETGVERGCMLSEYHNLLQEKLKGRRGEFLYRGQEDYDWKLRSGSIRRIFSEEKNAELNHLIESNVNFNRENLRYHEEELLEKAKRRGWHHEVGGRELNDLELLAKLQHYGAATCLLDFTTRFDIALWFACKSVQRQENGKEGDRDGRVFIVDIDSIPKLAFQRIGSDDLKFDIRKILRFETRGTEDKNQLPRDETPKFWYWHPETLMGRMLSQESRFLFGLRDIPCGSYLLDIRIKEGDKEPLLKELEEHHGLSQETIVSDIHGFATMNNHRVPFKQKNAEDYKQEGLRKLQMGDNDAAVQNFDEWIKLDEENDIAWYYRGKAKWLMAKSADQKSISRSKVNEYLESVISDCDKVTALNSENIPAYQLRCLAYKKLEKYSEAQSSLITLRELYDKFEDQKGSEMANTQIKEMEKLKKLN